MNKIEIIKFFYEYRQQLFIGNHLSYHLDLAASNELIYNSIIENNPLLVSRFGNVELDILLNYRSIKDIDYCNKYFSKIISLISGNQPCYWKSGNLRRFSLNAGFFPINDITLEEYCQLIINNIYKIDILGSWVRSEKYFSDCMPTVKRVQLSFIEPFNAVLPWTHALAGKKVLVIHPFSDLISKQYAKIDLIHTNGLMPNFELITLKAVQSAGGAQTIYKTWFDALNSMKNKIKEIDFDVAIIGAGAYGMPLGFFIKDLGKVAIHLGGVTQLLFGIGGARWSSDSNYESLFNKNWSLPTPDLKPPLADKIENGCYW